MRSFSIDSISPHRTARPATPFPFRRRILETRGGCVLGCAATSDTLPTFFPVESKTATPKNSERYRIILLSSPRPNEQRLGAFERSKKIPWQKATGGNLSADFSGRHGKPIQASPPIFRADSRRRAATSHTPHSASHTRLMPTGKPGECLSPYIVVPP